MSLTDTAIRNAKPGEKPVRLFDGGGLYLEVSPAGGKWWRLKYRFEGKEKRLSLGVYPDVSLRDARDRRDASRKLLADGTDPSENRKAMKSAEPTGRQTASRWWRGSGSPSIPRPGPRITATASSGVSNATSSRGLAGDRLPK